jgi:hypothetical protein
MASRTARRCAVDAADALAPRCRLGGRPRARRPRSRALQAGGGLMHSWGLLGSNAEPPRHGEPAQPRHRHPARPRLPQHRRRAPPQRPRRHPVLPLPGHHQPVKPTSPHVPRPWSVCRTPTACWSGDGTGRPTTWTRRSSWPRGSHRPAWVAHRDPPQRYVLVTTLEQVFCDQWGRCWPSRSESAGVVQR